MPDQDATAPAPAPPSANAPKRAASPLSPALVIALAAAFFFGVLLVALVVERSASTAGADSVPSSSTSPAAALARPSSAVLAESNAAAGPGWTGSKTPRWARDGSKMIEFDHVATRDVSVWMKRVRPVLAVRCLYGRTEVFVIPDTAASIEANDRHAVRVRFDDGPEVAQSWADSEDSQELFAPDGMTMARQIAQAHTMRFAFTPYNASAVVVDFDVRGFDELIGHVAKTCRWTP